MRLPHSSRGWCAAGSPCCVFTSSRSGGGHGCVFISSSSGGHSCVCPVAWRLTATGGDRGSRGAAPLALCSCLTAQHPQAAVDLGWIWAGSGG